MKWKCKFGPRQRQLMSSSKFTVTSPQGAVKCLKDLGWESGHAGQIDKMVKSRGRHR